MAPRSTIKSAAHHDALHELPKITEVAGGQRRIVDRPPVIVHPKELTVRLAESSRQAFADLTKAHVGQAVDVKIDGKSVIKPIIREPITGGVIAITVVTIDEGRQLAARLSSKTAKLDVDVVQ